MVGFLVVLGAFTVMTFVIVGTIRASNRMPISSARSSVSTYWYGGLGDGSVGGGFGGGDCGGGDGGGGSC